MVCFIGQGRISLKQRDGNKNVQNTGRGESRGRGLGNTFIKGFDLKEAPCELLYGFGFFWFDMKGATTSYCTVVWFLLVALKKSPHESEDEFIHLSHFFKTPLSKLEITVET